MDGNGRWAKARGLKRTEGHKEGTKVVRKITKWCAQRKIAYLSLYAFSTENWLRPSIEVDFLMKLLEKYLKNERKTYMENDIRFKVIGDIRDFSRKLRNLIDELQTLTARNSSLTQILALNYGSKDELARAFIKANDMLKSRDLEQNPLNLGRDSTRDSAKNAMDSSDFGARFSQDSMKDSAHERESTRDSAIALDFARDFATPTNAPLSKKDALHLLESNLDTAGIPPVDLLIRTGGEMRLSNFLLLQSAYAELYFSKTLFPDFKSDDLEKIIGIYKKRNRRFGAV